MSSELKICPRCNVKVDVSDDFCMDCGYDFSSHVLNNEVLVEPMANIEFIPPYELFNISHYFPLFENINEKVDYTIKAISESDWRTALVFIDQSLENNQFNADLWALKAYILIKLKYFEDALTTVNISLNLDDFNELAWACKAIILYLTRENIAALSCCDEFLSLNSINSDIIKLRESINDKINNPIEITQTTSYKINICDLKVNRSDFTPKRKFKNHLTEIKDILTVDNSDKLDTTYLTPKEYQYILDNIKSTSYKTLDRTILEDNIDLNSLSILDKILLFTKVFIDVDYKFKGKELGNYDFTKINLDDRLDDSNQITTLIHELAHYLITEIFEQALMIIWDTDKTYAIKSFVKFSLLKDQRSLLLNEYCAHTVEGRFTPHGYQNYGSFETILKSLDEKHESMIFKCMSGGNTFCNDILTILEPFINYNLREEIKQQFKKDFKINPHYKGISLEIKNTSSVEDLVIFINFILASSFDFANENPKDLFEFKNNFESQNKGDN